VAAGPSSGRDVDAAADSVDDSSCRVAAGAGRRAEHPEEGVPPGRSVHVAAVARVEGVDIDARRGYMRDTVDKADSDVVHSDPGPCGAAAPAARALVTLTGARGSPDYWPASSDRSNLGQAPLYNYINVCV